MVLAFFGRQVDALSALMLATAEHVLHQVH